MNSRERAELEHLRKENQKLTSKLAKSEAAVEILGKASALLAAMAESAAATDPHLEDLPDRRPACMAPPEDGRSSST